MSKYPGHRHENTPETAGPGDKANNLESKFTSQVKARRKLFGPELIQKPSTEPVFVTRNPIANSTHVSVQQSPKPPPQPPRKETGHVPSKTPVLPANENAESQRDIIMFQSLMKVPIYEIVALPEQTTEVFRPLLDTRMPPAKSSSNPQQQSILQYTSAPPPLIPLQERKTNSSQTSKPTINKKEITVRKREDRNIGSPTKNHFSRYVTYIRIPNLVNPSKEMISVSHVLNNLRLINTYLTLNVCFYVCTICYSLCLIYICVKGILGTRIIMMKTPFISQQRSGRNDSPAEGVTTLRTVKPY